MDAVPLSFESRGADTLVLHGDADETYVAELREHLESLLGGCDHATLDLSDVTFLPSAAIGAILRVRATARHRGADLRLVAADGCRAAQILRITGVGFDPA